MIQAGCRPHFSFREDATLTKAIKRLANRQHTRRNVRPSDLHAQPTDDSQQTFSEESFQDDEFDEDISSLEDESLDDACNADNTGDDDQIDDPVRIYLMQMGGHSPPDQARRDYRGQANRKGPPTVSSLHVGKRLCTPGGGGFVDGIRNNKLRLDRTIEVSVVNIREKNRLLKVLTPNLLTIQNLLRQNRRDFALAVHRGKPRQERQNAWRRILARRVKAVRLVEEMNLRTQRLQPMLDNLQKISLRMEAIREQLAKPCHDEDERAQAAELRKNCAI